MRLAERTHIDVGAEYFHDQQNCREMSPVKLRCGGTLDPIGVDISTVRHYEYGGHVHRSGKDDSGNLFASYFLRKEKIPPTHHRGSKYDTGQENRIAPPESSDVYERVINKFTLIKHIVNSGSDGGRGIIQCQSTTGSQVRKA